MNLETRRSPRHALSTPRRWPLSSIAIIARPAGPAPAERRLEAPKHAYLGVETAQPPSDVDWNGAHSFSGHAGLPMATHRQAADAPIRDLLHRRLDGCRGAGLIGMDAERPP